MSLRFCDIYDLRISVRGTLPPGPKIVVMNHLGYVDPMLFGALEAYLSIAKSEVARWPGVGDLARALGVLFVVRGDAYSGFRVLREVRRALDAGATVLNFPEGTTSDGRDVLPFHRGVFGVARHAGVPVVPVHLRFSNPDLAWIDDQTFMPHFLKFLGSESEAVELQILGAIEPGAAESAEGLAEHARQALRRVDPARLS
ncbi:MAG: lysophospholipid acyltransferase family protein [Myxococcota bacterium]